MPVYKLLLLLLCSLFFQTHALAQFGQPDLIDIDNDDLNIGGDIFSDYNEDVDSIQVVEDERFFRYGRFFSFSLGVGNTTFTGNRGLAYVNAPPSYSFQVSYFLNFRVSYTLGFEFSKHEMTITAPTRGFPDLAPGAIEISMLRPYFGARYAVDTSDLGTALTYSNPYLTARIEYWYQRNKFIDTGETYDTQSGSGLGFGLGGGFEFPIVIKEYYVGVELLYHTINLFDKSTQDFRASTTATSVETFQDLSGDALSFIVSFVINW